MKTQITNEIIKWIGKSINVNNQASANLRNKAPELADTIINMIVEEIEKIDDEPCHNEGHHCCVDIVKKIIKNLTNS
jgi:hypothetical protein